ncbi:hypothetical protein J6590_044054 [Homalodisca vitripennis]|nr:hypothetical protein J6590_044054 [Homalodisca vitripennis]
MEVYVLKCQPQWRPQRRLVERREEWGIAIHYQTTPEPVATLCSPSPTQSIKQKSSAPLSVIGSSETGYYCLVRSTSQCSAPTVRRSGKLMVSVPFTDSEPPFLVRD